MEKELLNKLADINRKSTVNYALGTCGNLVSFSIDVEMISEFLKDLAAAPVMAVNDVIRWIATDKAAKQLDEKTRNSLCDVINIALHIYGNQHIIGLLNYWFEDLDEILSKAIKEN